MYEFLPQVCRPSLLRLGPIAFPTIFTKNNPMFLLILGLLLLIGGFVIAGRTDSIKRYSSLLRLVGLFLAIVGLFSASIVQIGAGEVGVQILYGRVQNDVLNSGLHFINPLMEVQKMDVKTQNYTMSAIKDEGAKEGDDAIRVLTSDGLEVVIDLTVLYKVLPIDAPRIVRETGLDYTDKVVRPLTRTRIRDNAVYYDAVSLYSSKRDEFQRRIFESITGEFQKRGLLLEQLLIRNISLPQAVKTSIEQKMSAEQDAQKMEYVLQKEQQEAQRKRVEAQGIADYQRIISESLTDRQLQYESIKAQLEIAKSANAKVIILGKGGTPVMLDTKN
jgi:regulator of protease activity HflC (stomatin/prohibitin superfamily)